MTDLVLSEMRDRVAILTLNRPDKLNALNYALIDRLLSLLDRIETDDGVHAVIITGAGERAFPPAPIFTNSRWAWPKAPMSRYAIS